MPASDGTNRLKCLREPVDMSNNGQCSRCGQCCPSIICASEDEIARMAELAKRIKPVMDLGDVTGPTIYARCPFLIKRQYFPAYCQIYEDRPRVCQTFNCWHSNHENAEHYVDTGGESQPAVNLWTLFGLTGIYDGNGNPIPADNPYHVDVDLSGGRTLRLQMGRPITLWTSSGRYVPPSLIVGIAKDGLQIFNGDLQAIEVIPFKEIDALDVPENTISRRTRKDRRKERKKKH